MAEELEDTEYVDSTDDHDHDDVEEAIAAGSSDPSMASEIVDGSLQFTNGTFPMQYIFQSGTQNPDRPVIAHSPRYSDWGLMYSDPRDRMIFQANGSPVLTAELGGREVGIRTDSPNHTLDVRGTIAARDEYLLENSAGKEIFSATQFGNINLGGNGDDGDLLLFPSSATTRQTDRANIWADGQYGHLMLGGNGTDGDIALFAKGTPITSPFSKATIHINGQAGDIVLQNADCAEDFDVADDADPGTVMVLDDEESVRTSTEAYDTRVAGVLSGAGEYRPGLVLDKQADRENRLPLALMGKVFCKADAAEESIATGDMLTTAEETGHAMKATDAARSFGAVLGKALRPLDEGRDLIPVLVALQ